MAISLLSSVAGSLAVLASASGFFARPTSFKHLAVQISNIERLMCMVNAMGKHVTAVGCLSCFQEASVRGGADTWLQFLLLLTCEKYRTFFQTEVEVVLIF